MPKVKKKKGASKAAALANAINAQLGTDTVRLGDDEYFKIVRMPTGSLTIDRLTGGGFARGRHVELYGDESACKSYIAYRTLALAQDNNYICGLIDPEKVFDGEWFTHLGGDTESLITQRPQTAEDCIKAMALMFQSGEVAIVVVDSVAALLPRELRESDPSDEDRLASQARFMSKALRYLTTLNENTLVLWTNQTRANIGGYGNVTPGGKALRFYDTTRIELKKGELVRKSGKVAKAGKLVEGKTVRGHWVQCRSVKEKSAHPYREGSFYFDGGRGEIDLASEIIQLGLTDGLITRAGNTFTYVDIDDVEWSGMEAKFKRLIYDNEQLRVELVEAIADNTLRMSRADGNSENV